MARLIDADAFKVFLEGVRQDYIEENTFSSDFAANVIETVQDNYLDIAPTVDAVPVVYCKDCKHWVHLEDGRGDCTNGRFHIPGICDITMNADEFCCFGERRDND